jgi:hypothetical protein
MKAYMSFVCLYYKGHLYTIHIDSERNTCINFNVIVFVCVHMRTHILHTTVEKVKSYTEEFISDKQRFLLLQVHGFLRNVC